KLARDILETIQALGPTAFSGLQYAIPEPLPLLRAAQFETLAAFRDKLAQVSHPDEFPPLPGIAFGNEVLDALPFHLIEWRQGRWLDVRVQTNASGGLKWNLDTEFSRERLP